jgi:hypothetical protein
MALGARVEGEAYGGDGDVMMSCRFFDDFTVCTEGLTGAAELKGLNSVEVLPTCVGDAGLDFGPRYDEAVGEEIEDGDLTEVFPFLGCTRHMR